MSSKDEVDESSIASSKKKKKNFYGLEVFEKLVDDKGLSNAKIIIKFMWLEMRVALQI